MNEGTLKQKWRRHATKLGFLVKSLSPHQIRGLPDLVVADSAGDALLRDMVRVRSHWVEAKVRKKPPAGRAFDAKRDATVHQTRWMLQFAALGAPCWWLLLDEKKWMLVPGDQLTVTQDEWNRRARRYGDRIQQLEEPEVNRDRAVKEAQRRLEAVERQVGRAFMGTRQ